MRAIGYIRVNTGKQADVEISFAAQREELRAMAAVQHSDLIEIVVDAGESAKDLKRPGIERILELVNAGQVDTVIVVSLDRLTRSVRDLRKLLAIFKRRNVSLVSVAEALDSGTVSGRRILKIIGGPSQRGSEG